MFAPRQSGSSSKGESKYLQEHIGPLHGQVRGETGGNNDIINMFLPDWQTTKVGNKISDPTIKILVERYKNMFNSILEYYITPAYSRFTPFDEQPRWATLPQAKHFGANGPEDSYLTILLGAEQSSGLLTIDDLSDLEQITEVLLFLNSSKATPNDKKDMNLDVLKHRMQTLVQKITEIFGATTHIKNGAMIEIGNALHQTLRRNRIESQVLFFGQPTRHWADEYDENKTYPFAKYTYLEKILI